MSETTTNETTVVAPAAVPAAPVTPAAPAPAPAASAFALPSGEVQPTLATGLPEAIPAKYHVKKEDGTLDIEATAAKLAEGHKHLESRFGKGEAAPESVEGYEPKVEGFDIEELKVDPLYQSFLKGAHSRGINNETLSWILNEYATRAGQEQAAAVMTPDDLRAAMEPAWADIGGYDAGIGFGRKAIQAFAPDATPEEIASLPNHPLVAKILANVGREVGEDRLPGSGAQVNVGDWESQAAAIRASEAYNTKAHPEHKIAVDKLEALYAQRYGKVKRPVAVTASVKA